MKNELWALITELTQMANNELRHSVDFPWARGFHKARRDTLLEIAERLISILLKEK